MVTALATNLVTDALRLRYYAEDPAWQRAWLSLESENWHSLAIVPTGDLCSLDLVHGLASVAWQQRGTPLIIADLQEISLSTLAAARGELRRRAQGGDRILVAVRSLEKNPTTASLLRETDRTLLCIHAGLTAKAHIRNAIREVGGQRCIGAVFVRSNGDPSRAMNGKKAARASTPKAF